MIELAAGDLSSAAPDSESSGATSARVLGIDIYTLRARLMPALLASLPVIALGVVALPWLEEANKFWSLVGLGVTTFAALIARRAGNRVQPKLYLAWGGIPTTARLRYASETSREEIDRRHRLVERILGDSLTLPTADEERHDPVAADRRYSDAMRRIVSKLRNNSIAPMVTGENRNYGFARNLLGLKPIGIASAAFSLVLAAAVAGYMLNDGQGIGAAIMLLPAAAAVTALCLWPLVDFNFVRPSAEAYADRIIDALDDLKPSRRP